MFHQIGLSLKTRNIKDKETGEILSYFYEKMSKSKYNGVAPEDVIGQYGVDTARMFILFKAPPEKDLEWNDADVEGQFRFINRIWRQVSDYLENKGNSKGKGKKKQKEDPKAIKALRRAIHTAIQEISEDLGGDYQFNTAVSELMKLSNALNEFKCFDSPVYQEGVETLLKLLAPFAPHVAEELWNQLSDKGSIHDQSWPEVDPSALVLDEITLVIQIMGKTRGTIQIPANSDKAALEKYARDSEIAQRHLEGKTIKK